MQTLERGLGRDAMLPSSTAISPTVSSGAGRFDEAREAYRAPTPSTRRRDTVMADDYDIFAPDPYDGGGDARIYPTRREN